MTRFAFFDCFSGISGDMSLAALIDLGADPAQIQAAVRSMGLPDLNIRVAETKKCGFRALGVQIEHPPEHAHRHLHHITEMIDRADQIDPDAKALAKRIFGHVAVAEAKVHGTTLEKVHFHEVGAIDSIGDIVGVAVAVTALNISSAMALPVPTGTGSIRIAHGTVSVPAPATAEILTGIPVVSTDIRAELTTPTGAAILKELCGEFGPLPAMTVDRIGYGAGTMDLPEQANLLRVLLGQRSPASAGSAHQIAEQDTVSVLQTNLDDTSGEQLADCVSRLVQRGALDVTQTPCMMKKGRSGVILSVICQPADVAAMEQIMFTHTSTIGIRRSTALRDILPRHFTTVQTKFGPVRAKVSTLPGGDQRIKIEDDDARRLAAEHQTTADIVRREAECAGR
ncbi:nickel pincer cofactor biosynthesis protein LarC [Roseiconus nitratireducens]|uniref:Putative nickel insertion protein n=1 Tax=Roseiconus nitratireducens TaxID=2605748 RepID=A0A5M6CZJ2_9BACT|nr:nickel pincer cofactor biosynthesis protein LarC [Roseiconus nitratireducens]KAA5540667.1 nickel pincer cofactor biosynthesis protein LarC [Roseiconus nitratireducens]